MVLARRYLHHYGRSYETTLGLDDAAFFAAIGWLAREKKIYCSEDNGEWYISNKQPLGFFSFG